LGIADGGLRKIEHFALGALHFTLGALRLMNIIVSNIRSEISLAGKGWEIIGIKHVTECRAHGV
jgi:hypothetical protein